MNPAIIVFIALLAPAVALSPADVLRRRPEGNGATLFKEQLARLRLRRRNVTRLREKIFQRQRSECLSTLAAAEKDLRAFYRQ
jgi:hypothetical protein